MIKNDCLWLFPPLVIGYINNSWEQKSMFYAALLSRRWLIFIPEEGRMAIWPKAKKPWPSFLGAPWQRQSWTKKGNFCLLNIFSLKVIRLWMNFVLGFFQYFAIENLKSMKWVKRWKNRNFGNRFLSHEAWLREKKRGISGCFACVFTIGAARMGLFAGGILAVKMRS